MVLSGFLFCLFGNDSRESKKKRQKYQRKEGEKKRRGNVFVDERIKEVTITIRDEIRTCRSYSWIPNGHLSLWIFDENFFGGSDQLAG